MDADASATGKLTGRALHRGDGAKHGDGTAPLGQPAVCGERDIFSGPTRNELVFVDVGLDGGCSPNTPTTYLMSAPTSVQGRTSASRSCSSILVVAAAAASSSSPDSQARWSPWASTS